MNATSRKARTLAVLAVAASIAAASTHSSAQTSRPAVAPQADAAAAAAPASTTPASTIPSPQPAAHPSGQVDPNAPACPTAAGPIPATQHTITVGTHPRTYYLCTPPAMAVRAVPLVVVAHSWTKNAKHIADLTGWSRLGAREGFATAYPAGTSNSWNAGWCCGTAQRDKVDDINLFDVLVADTRHRARLNGRVFYAGLSNGGMLGFRLACGDRGPFRAFALSAATAVVSTCNPKNPRPVLAFNGLKDTTVPYRGCTIAQSSSTCARLLKSNLHPVPTVMHSLARASGCASIRRWAVNTKTTRYDGQRCTKPAHSSITLATAGHSWTTDARTYGIDQTATAWAFFKNR